MLCTRTFFLSVTAANGTERIIELTIVQDGYRGHNRIVKF